MKPERLLWMRDRTGAKRGMIGNGLHHITVELLDGIEGGNQGGMMLHDGRIHGGDASFDYIGAYTSAKGKWKGELGNHEHSPSQGERPRFAAHEVGVGFC